MKNTLKILSVSISTMDGHNQIITKRFNSITIVMKLQNSWNVGNLKTIFFSKQVLNLKSYFEMKIF